MTDPVRRIPGSSTAGQVLHPAEPELHSRYPDGVYIDLHGFPDWTPYARTVVESTDPPPGLAIDEVRVTDVLAANELCARTGDQLWERRGPAVHTPAGWVWAHIARSRRLALVPASLHASFRHLGGVSTLEVNRHRTGLDLDDEQPDLGEQPRTDYVRVVPLQQVTEPAVAKVEQHLGVTLPPSYRAFVMATNGGWPQQPGVHPDHGFVVDQPFLGIGRLTWFEELSFANMLLRDRLTPEFLAVGYVQGGIIAVRVAGEDTGSVWYWDDDNPNDDEAFGAAEISGQLLARCGDNFQHFWESLHTVPNSILSIADSAVDTGTIRILHEPGTGSNLPAVDLH